MIIERRIYTAALGKMPALIARFDHHTLGIWQRLGIVASGFMTTLIGPSNQELAYDLVWPDLATRERLWTVFLADPEWIAARAASEVDGPLVANVASSFLVPLELNRRLQPNAN